jgi:hypothetical protein
MSQLFSSVNPIFDSQIWEKFCLKFTEFMVKFLRLPVDPKLPFRVDFP